MFAGLSSEGKRVVLSSRDRSRGAGSAAFYAERPEMLPYGRIPRPKLGKTHLTWVCWSPPCQEHF